MLELLAQSAMRSTRALITSYCIKTDNDIVEMEDKFEANGVLQEFDTSCYHSNNLPRQHEVR